MNRFERLVWKAVIVAVVLIIILFLWQEWGSFSIYKKINHDKLAAFATAVAAILTAATVYLLYKQIREQQKDRKLDSHPLIYVDSFYFSRTKVKTMFINVGKGIAKGIKVEFEFDRLGFAETFGHLEVEALTNEPIERKDYILPTEQNDLELPQSYVKILMSHFLMNPNEVHLDKFPLELKIEYKDFYDVCFFVRYIVHFGKPDNNQKVFVKFERLGEYKKI